MNNTNGSFPLPIVTSYNTSLAIIKFIIGFTNVCVYIPTACIIKNCHTIGQSSKKLLCMMCSIYCIDYLILTFYSPFVGMGFFSAMNQVWFLKLMSCLFLWSIYALHVAETIMAADRFFGIKYPKLHRKLFGAKSTVALIVFVYLYGLAFGLASYFDCCYIVYIPVSQVWFYPNDKEMNYRLKTGLVSNWSNAIMTVILYASALFSMKKMRSQISDERMKRSNSKREHSLFLIFVIPPLIHFLVSVLVLICQVVPPPFWLQQVMDFGRYIFVIEPILMFCSIKQLRNLLKSMFLKYLCCKSPSAIMSQLHTTTKSTVKTNH